MCLVQVALYDGVGALGTVFSGKGSNYILNDGFALGTNDDLGNRLRVIGTTSLEGNTTIIGNFTLQKNQDSTTSSGTATNITFNGNNNLGDPWEIYRDNGVTGDLVISNDNAGLRDNYIRFTIAGETILEKNTTINGNIDNGLNTISTRNIVLGNSGASGTNGGFTQYGFVSGEFWRFETGTNTWNIKDWGGTSLISLNGSSDSVTLGGNTTINGQLTIANNATEKL